MNQKKKKTVNDFEKSSLAYLREISGFKPLEQTEELRLWREYKEKNDLSARDKLINANLKFVINIAKKYQGYGLSYSDLIAEGNMGLMKAIDKFDGEKGFKIITYSAFWIKQSIIDALNKRNGIEGEELPNDYNYPIVNADDDDICIGVNDNFIEDDTFSEIQDNSLKEVLGELLQYVNDKENFAISEYYGLSGEDPKTLEEIGKEIGVTKERVRQIIGSAFKKIRTAALSLNIDKSIY